MDAISHHGSDPYALLAELEGVSQFAHPPLDEWNPVKTGVIDIRIARDGTWYHEGDPITRPRVVRLFSTVLRKEGDGEFYLVTPTEKLKIRVDDVPFMAVLLASQGEGESQEIRFTTNVADEVLADRSHGIRIEVDQASGQPSPYLLVRSDLEAKLTRSVFYQLMDLSVEREYEGANWVGVWSCGHFFPLSAYAGAGSGEGS